MFVDMYAVNSAVLYLYNLIAHGGKCKIMCDYYNCHAIITARILEQFKNRLTCIVIKCSCRFITQKELRVLSQRPCNGNSLLLSAR